LAELVGLLVETSTPLDDKTKTALVEHGKEYLLSSGWSADDLRPLCDLMRNHSELFTEADKRVAQASLKETIRVLDSNKDEYDPESLREQARAFESIAAELGTDIADEIADIEYYAAEQESQMDDEPADITDSSSHPSFEGWCSDDTIASLFSSLSDQ
jgi:hypothetical protein